MPPGRWREGGTLTRRGLLAAGTASLALAACARVGDGNASAGTAEAARQLLGDTVTVDMHSHAGRILRRAAREDLPFGPVAEPMREGGMAVICLAMVADSPVTRVSSDGRIAAFRTAAPGELYDWSRVAFGRVARLIEQQRLATVTDAATLRAARANAPSVIVAAEGSDFLDRSVERLDEAHATHRLCHLQLTHYRVNDLGDIQTEPSVHGGLTDFGADVIRACNRLGIVVDVAHGTYDLVKRAVGVATKPLVLSHSSLTDRPRAYSRQITADHAHLVADTGGVIGIWPPQSIFRDMAAYAAGIARMVDVVGIDHVGIGSDMLGLTGPAVFASYRDLPALAEQLRLAGFQPDETRRILGGNYVRVFTEAVG
jgi:membrane dipeptidase